MRAETPMTTAGQRDRNDPASHSTTEIPTNVAA